MLYNTIVFLPLLSFIIVGLNYKNISNMTTSIVTCSSIALSALLSWILFFQKIFYNIEDFQKPIFNWITCEDLIFNWSFHIDSLTIIMFVIINSISAIVHVYSIGYMDKDPSFSRFFSYLSLFTFMMLIMVASDNLLQMFFAWEGVGLVSYLLIGFWYEKQSANTAAIKAFIINRFGDVGFLIGIFGIFFLFKTVNFDSIFQKIGEDFLHQKTCFLGWEITLQNSLNIVCLFLFFGAMSKSAQFLFHTWLPDAMEGPTPVSALIHSATMVTSGIFMIVRMFPLFSCSHSILIFITIIGMITAIFSASIGLVQNDIKRIIAYSTCSQLGYMFVALGVGSYTSAMFHLFTHAFFKALLFLSAGSIIHAVSGEQDIRNMGGLKKYIPITYITMVIGTLSLTGFGIPGTIFGTSGFFSKDSILESLFISQNPMAIYLFLILTFCIFLTSFYSWRLIFKVFHGKLRIPPNVMHQVYESPPVMIIPLIILSIAAILFGVIFKSYFFNQFQKEHFLYFSEQLHNIPIFVSWIPAIFTVIGFTTAFYFYIIMPFLMDKIKNLLPKLYNTLLNKFYFDEIYDKIFVKLAFVLGNFFYTTIDHKTINNFGPDGIASIISFLSKRAVLLQTGYLYHYAFVMLSGLVAFITFLIFESIF